MDEEIVFTSLTESERIAQLCTSVEELDALIDTKDARIAELEAKVARVEALANEHFLPSVDGLIEDDYILRGDLLSALTGASDD